MAPVQHQQIDSGSDQDVCSTGYYAPDSRQSSCVRFMMTRCQLDASPLPPGVMLSNIHDHAYEMSANPKRQIQSPGVGDLWNLNPTDTSLPPSVRDSEVLRDQMHLSRVDSQETGTYASQATVSASSSVDAVATQQPTQPPLHMTDKGNDAKAAPKEEHAEQNTLQSDSETVGWFRWAVSDWFRQRGGSDSIESQNDNNFNFQATFRNRSGCEQFFIVLSTFLAIVTPFISLALCRTIALGNKESARLVYFVGLITVLTCSGVAVSLFKRNIPILVMSLIGIMVFGIFAGGYLDLVASYPYS
jgi:hypothetical protein